MKKSMFSIGGYLAVIPKIQNVYFVEHCESSDSYQWGFKYDSGVFEFFSYKTAEEARADYDRCAEAIEEYYGGATSRLENPVTEETIHAHRIHGSGCSGGTTSPAGHSG